jgi:hypothetical protein
VLDLLDESFLHGANLRCRLSQGWRIALCDPSERYCGFRNLMLLEGRNGQSQVPWFARAGCRFPASFLEADRESWVDCQAGCLMAYLR